LITPPPPLSRHTHERYLAAFEWRYDRRFGLKENLGRLALVAAKTIRRPNARWPRSGRLERR
jgi:hypothetical protein